MDIPVYFKSFDDDKYKYLGKSQPIFYNDKSIKVITKRNIPQFAKVNPTGINLIVFLKINNVEFKVSLVEISKDWSGKGLYKICYEFKYRW